MIDDSRGCAEYSLLERTVEGALMPAAASLGLGVTPWSPLGGGLLTGKYTREHMNGGTSDRGAFGLSRLTESVFTLVDEPPRTPVPRRPRSQAGVTSIIIGARRLSQLDQNLAALDLSLSAEQTACPLIPGNSTQPLAAD